MPPVHLDVKHCYYWCLHQSNLFNVCFKYFFFVKVRKEDITGLDTANISVLFQDQCHYFLLEKSNMIYNSSENVEKLFLNFDDKTQLGGI